jgi:hypothetical protein
MKLALVILITLSTVASAGRPEVVSILGTDLQLGMVKKDVIATLTRAGLDPHNSDASGDSISVMQKNGTNQTPSFLGILTFKNERLVFINKSWTPDESTASTIGNGMYGALSSMTGSNRWATCQVISGASVNQTSESKEVDIRCGGAKYISLLITRYQGQEFISVSEVLNGTTPAR